MAWLRAVEELRSSREHGVLVTVASVRGHAPREAGAKMVVAVDRTWGSVGGGNLEAVAVARARALLADGSAQPELLPAVVATTSGWSLTLVRWVLASTRALAQVRLPP